MNWKLKHDKFQIRRAAILSAAFCLLCAPATVLAQTQLGADIDGEAADDYSGEVSLAWFTYDTEPPGSDGTIILIFNSSRKELLPIYITMVVI